MNSQLSKAHASRRVRPRLWTGLAVALAVAGCGTDSGMPTNPSFAVSASSSAARSVSISPDNTAGDPYSVGTITAPFSATNSIVQSFTITNTGTKATSAITVSLSGTGASAYSIAAGDDGCTGRSLGTALKHNSCTVKVTFDPSSAGTFLATLEVALAQPKRSFTVNLTGTGADAATSSLDIESVVQGADVEVGFTSTGGLSQPTFSLANGKGLTLSPAAGHYTVTETVPTGYMLFSIACVSSPGTGVTLNLGLRTATIDLAEGGKVTCTFTTRQLTS